MNTRRLFSDFDGTFVKFMRQNGPDVYSARGYSLGLETHENYVEALSILNKDPDLEVWGDSAVLPFDYCKEEKTARFAEAGIPAERCAFTLCGEKKAEGLISQGVLRDGDILIEDWNPNLYEARETGLDLILIKICTEESDSTKSWDGYRISSASSPEAIARTIKGIILAHNAELAA